MCFFFLLRNYCSSVLPTADLNSPGMGRGTVLSKSWYKFELSVSAHTEKTATSYTKDLKS